MIYNIFISKRAIEEIEQAIAYYSQYSSKAPLNFVEELQIAYNTLKQNPQKRIFYRNVRGIKLKISL